MTSAELSEWLAYDRIEPLPDPWYQHGVLASLICGAFGKPSKPEDWIPSAPADRSVDVAKARLMAWAASTQGLPPRE